MDVVSDWIIDWKRSDELDDSESNHLIAPVKFAGSAKNVNNSKVTANLAKHFMTLYATKPLEAYTRAFKPAVKKAQDDYEGHPIAVVNVSKPHRRFTFFSASWSVIFVWFSSSHEIIFFQTQPTWRPHGWNANCVYL